VFNDSGPYLPWPKVADAMLRQGSRGEEENESTCATCQRNPVGTQSYPVRASHPPAASLASSSVMAARSGDSECKSRVSAPRKKAKSQEASWSSPRGQHRPHSPGVVGTVLPGSESRAYAHGGSRGTWEILSLSALQSPAGTIRRTKSQARGRGVWPPRERNTSMQGAVP
jgi:hypothetical protein